MKDPKDEVKKDWNEDKRLEKEDKWQALNPLPFD